MIESDLWITSRQFAAFCLAGALHTSLDFLIYNLLTRSPRRWPRIAANCVSTTAAMSFSFTANLLFVFHPELTNGFSRAMKFVAITAFSSYVLQNFVIYVTSSVWLVPVRSATWLSARFDRTRSLGDDFVQKNTVKSLAVGAGILWNFVWYKFFVFAD